MIFISGTAYQPKTIDQYRPNVEIETKYTPIYEVIYSRKKLSNNHVACLTEVAHF